MADFNKMRKGLRLFIWKKLENFVANIGLTSCWSVLQVLMSTQVFNSQCFKPFCKSTSKHTSMFLQWRGVNCVVLMLRNFPTGHSKSRTTKREKRYGFNWHAHSCEVVSLTTVLLRHDTLCCFFYVLVFVVRQLILWLGFWISQSINQSTCQCQRQCLLYL